MALNCRNIQKIYGKYTDFIVTDNVKYRDIKIDIFNKSFSAIVTYKDIEFWIDLNEYSDSFVSEYIVDRVAAIDIGRNDFIFLI
jgi:hypothetical protein